jgi:hypothetical protein
MTSEEFRAAGAKGRTAAADFSASPKQKYYAFVFGSKRHRSLIGQRQHSGLRALQMYRPCKINQ